MSGVRGEVGRGSSGGRVLVAGVLAAGVLAGCRSLGTGVVDGLHDRREKLADVAGDAGEAAVAGAGRSFGDSVRPELIGTLDSAARRVRDSVLALVLDSVEARLLRVEDSLAGFVEGRGSDAVRALVAENLDEVRVSVDAAVARWMGTVSASVDSELRLAAADAVGHAVAGARDTLAVGLGDPEGLGGTVEELGESVVERAIATIEAETDRPTPWWVWALAAALGLLVVSAVGGFILKLRADARRREVSLRILGRAIQERGARGVADRVRSLAAEQGVEGWLHGFLRERRLLVEEEGDGAGR